MLCLLVSLILPGLCLGSGDSTLTDGMRGSAVVEAAIQRVDHSCIFADDKLFFRRLAFVESRDGMITSTFRNAYHGGIWQVDKNAFDTTKTSDSYLRTHKQKIRKYFNIDWDFSRWEDLRKPLYSLLAVKLYFGYETKSSSGGIPWAIKDQANLWRWKYRKTKDANAFIHKAQQLESGCKTSPGVDLSFVLDGSGSIGRTNFQQIKIFVRYVVQAFKDTIEKGTSQVSVIQFSSTSKVEFYFNKYSSTQQILQAVDNIRYMGGGTGTDLALDEMTQSVFSTFRGARLANSEHPRVGVVLTDGASNSMYRTIAAAKKAHDKDIILFSVGVGTNLRKTELESIASDPVCLHLFELKQGFVEIESLKSAIIKRTCDAPIPPLVPDKGSKKIDISPNMEIKCKVFIPKVGSTVKVEAHTGSITYYVAQRAYPNEAFYDHKVEATPGKRGVIFISRNNVTNTDFSVFCSIKAKNQAAEVSVVVETDNKDWCRTRPCGIGGQCLDLGPAGYRCACQPRYTGRRCQTVIDYCSPNPCKAGTCRNQRDQGNQFTCICPPGKKGKLCDEVIDYCSPNPCKAGTCRNQRDRGNQFTCICPPGKKGKLCDEVMDNCSPNPCKAGTCRNQRDQGKQFTCICPSGKKGKLCDEDTRPDYDCGTRNPCTEENRKKKKYYFPHSDRSRFVQCNDWGQCFVMPCATGLVWNDNDLTCNRP